MVLLELVQNSLRKKHAESGQMIQSVRHKHEDLILDTQQHVGMEAKVYNPSAVGWVG